MLSNFLHKHSVKTNVEKIPGQVQIVDTEDTVHPDQVNFSTPIIKLVVPPHYCCIA
jgi:hypothetical protein